MRWLFLIALAACADHEVEALRKVKDAVCTCKSSSCAELAMKDVPTQDIKASARAQAVARDMMDCLSKLHDAERPSTDPDAPATGSDRP